MQKSIQEAMRIRKYGRKYMMAVWVCLVMILYAIIMPGMFITDRMLLLLTAALVACVYIVCESRVDRAAAPLNLPEGLLTEKAKPPEGDTE